MDAADTRVRLPVLPAPEVLADRANAILSDDGSVMMIYDPLTSAGFVYVFAKRRWHITAPVDFDTFAGTLALSGYRLADNAESMRWMARCGATPAPGKTH